MGVKGARQGKARDEQGTMGVKGARQGKARDEQDAMGVKGTREFSRRPRVFISFRYRVKKQTEYCVYVKRVYPENA
ncbi:reticulocyte-binding protein 2 homolog a [Plakobranchus ocellatus]|uniref:Reticulocyte-binding protein 2 homolog a n=1 Tax=Plakobranchus ocellatus TaxID=259542 RepID=A0AAV4C4K8_9GAST|nr:reticulocyte-binding protein 2 homolog a [Plakobranchus ocellatus]